MRMILLAAQLGFAIYGGTLHASAVSSRNETAAVGIQSSLAGKVDLERKTREKRQKQDTCSRRTFGILRDQLQHS